MISGNQKYDSINHSLQDKMATEMIAEITHKNTEDHDRIITA